MKFPSSLFKKLIFVVFLFVTTSLMALTGLKGEYEDEEEKKQEQEQDIAGRTHMREVTEQGGDATSLV
ncbi:MAG: hypothetical protein WCO92_04370 [Verrucomicrobiota bacterium]